MLILKLIFLYILCFNPGDKKQGFMVIKLSYNYKSKNSLTRILYPIKNEDFR